MIKRKLKYLLLFSSFLILLTGCNSTSTSAVETEQDTTFRHSSLDAVIDTPSGNTVPTDIQNISQIQIHYNGHFSNCKNTERINNSNNTTSYTISKDGSFLFSNLYDHCENNIKGTFPDDTISEIFAMLDGCHFHEYQSQQTDKNGFPVTKLYPNCITLRYQTQDYGFASHTYQLPKNEFLQLLEAADNLKQIAMQQ